MTLKSSLVWLLVAAPLAMVMDTPRAQESADTEKEQQPAAEEETSKEKPSKLRSEEDGQLDLSGFLDEIYGFVPILIPITEPAVGYGAAGGLVFIDKAEGQPAFGIERPNITAVGGFATQNGSSGFLAGDVRHYGENRVQTVVAAIHASVNLDFYGSGDDDAFLDDPLRYTLDPIGGVVRGRYRFGDSRLWAGLGYAWVVTEVGLEETPANPDLDFTDESRVGGLTPSLTWDSRDNIFTPTRGTYLEGFAGVFAPALGSDDSFQRAGLILIDYRPLGRTVTLGVRGNATFSFSDPPFYLLPFVPLRGAPVLRYQGEEAADLETEARWQFYKRFSLVGFVGAGAAWNDFENLDDVSTVVTGGTGFRYELARKYGLHAGLDIAFGPDGPALYIQFGNAWARP